MNIMKHLGLPRNVQRESDFLGPTSIKPTSEDHSMRGREAFCSGVFSRVIVVRGLPVVGDAAKEFLLGVAVEGPKE